MKTPDLPAEHRSLQPRPPETVKAGILDHPQAARDRRAPSLVPAEAERSAPTRTQALVRPSVDAAVLEMGSDLDGPLPEQLVQPGNRVSAGMSDERTAAILASPELRLHDFADEFAQAFSDINAEWISGMFTLEQTDRDVLEQPRRRIIDTGGAILFAEADGLGIVGTCALQKTGNNQFELTKMGVRGNARGLKAGEFLLRAAIDRAAALNAERLYLLTNRKCAPAVHLYEKLGFVHSAEIMEQFGSRYQRCDVAMLYDPSERS